MDRNAKIRLTTIAMAVSGALAFIGCGGGGGSSVELPAGPKQPAGMENLKAMGDPKATLSVEGKLYRDLDGNGKLDVYEDWKNSAEVRGDGLLNAIAADKKAVADEVPEGVQQLIGLMNVYNTFVAGAEGTALAIPGVAVSNCKDGESKEYKYVCEKEVRFYGLMPSMATTEMMKVGGRYYTIRETRTKAEVMAEWTNNMQKIAAKTSKWGIPAVFTANPQNHASTGAGFAEASGVYSYWPNIPGMGAAMLGEKEANGGKYTSFIKDFAQLAAKEWVATGVRKGYMYQADLASEPRWNRNNGTFGDDPDLVAEIQKQLVEGFQDTRAGDFKLKPHSVALTTKHFPGNGIAPRGVDSHDAVGKFAPYTTQGSLLSWQIKPFKAAIDAGTSSIMTYYQIPDGNVEQLPKDYWFSSTQQFEAVGAAFNKKLLDYLKGPLNFKGYINSDSRVTLKEGQPHGVEDYTPEARVVKTINAGLNLLSLGHGEIDASGKTTVWGHEQMLNAYKSGKISLETIKKAVKPLLTEMFQLGLFDNPYVDVSKVKSIVKTPEAQAKADLAHRKSIVLLKNDNVLPLKLDSASVKLYVEVFAKTEDNADAAKANLKTKAMRDFVKATYPNVQVVEDYTQATHSLLLVSPVNFLVTKVDGQDVPHYQEIEINANTTGAKVPRIGEIQDAMVQAGKPVIVVVNMGNPWLIDGIEPKAKAMITTYDVTNDALFDVITGKFNPIGRLPIAIPRNLDEVKNNVPDTPGHMEKSPSYAYKDALGNVYTFKHGLSYKQ